MKTRAGLYWCLKDKSRSFEDKVKVVRYAWKYDNVYIPNKEQVLVDWLCQTLTGRVRLTPLEEDQVLMCLFEVLHTKKCQHLSVKANLCAILLEKLLEKREDSLLLISCCMRILKSKELGHNFVMKFENMVYLLSTTLKVFYEKMTAVQKKVNCEVKAKITDMTKLSLELFLEVVKRKGNPQHVMQQVAKKALKIAIRVLGLERKENEELEEIQRKIKEVLILTLYPRDLSSHYQLFTKVETAETKSDSSAPKFIEVVFTQLKEMIADQEEAVFKFLPVLLQGLVDSYNFSQCDTNFKFLQIICKILCINTKTSNNLKIHLKVSTLRSLLNVCVSRDLYDLGYDYNNDSRQLKWFQSLTTWLLETEERSGPWFDCLRLLLSMNHHILDKKISTVLNEAWVHCQPQGDASDAQDAFLQEIVKVYAKLRQMHTLMKKMFECFQSDIKSRVLWPTRFYKQLCISFTELPQGTVPKIWEQFLSEIQDDNNVSSNSNSHQTEALIRLFSFFLLHVKVVGYQLISHLSEKVSALMEQTKSQILEPLMGEFIKKKCVTTYVLELMHSWKELEMLLQQYGHGSDRSPVHTAYEATDLSLLFPFVSQTLWKKIFDLVEKSGSASGKYLLLLLCVQKVKYLLSLDSNMTKTTSVQNVTDYICEKLNGEYTENTWNQQICDINEKNLEGAKWRLFYEKSSVLFPQCNAAQKETIAGHLLDTLMQDLQESTSDVTMSGMSSLAKDFIFSPMFQEMKHFHKVLLSAIVEELNKMFTTQTPKSKKQKKLATSPSRLFDVLHKMVKQSEISEEVYQNIGQLLQGLVDQRIQKTGQTLTENHQVRIQEMLNVLLALPVEYFGGQEKACCCILALAVLCLVPDETSINQSKLVSICYTMMLVLLEEYETGSWLEKLLPPGKALVLFTFLPHDGDSSKRLKEFFVKVAMKEENSLLTLKSYVNELQEKLLKKELTEEVLNDTAVVLEALAKKSNHKVSRVGQEFYEKLWQPYASLIEEASGTSLTLLMSGFSRLLPYIQKPVEGDTKSPLEEFLPKMCRHCIDNLQNNKNYNHTGTFIKNICKNWEKVKDIIPPKWLLQLWPCLLHQMALTANTDTIYSQSEVTQNGTHSIDGGNKKGLSEDFLETDLGASLLSVIQLSNEKEFEEILECLVKSLKWSNEESKWRQIVFSLLLWQHILNLPLGEEQGAVLMNATQNLLVNLQMVLREVRLIENKESVNAVTNACIQAMVKMIEFGPVFLSAQNVQLCLQMFYLPMLSALPHQDFVNRFHLMYDLLNQMLVSHTQAVCQMIPAFVSATTYLLKAVIIKSDQDSGKQTDEEIHALSVCGHLIDRLLTLMSSNKVEFQKVSVYIVVDYVNEIQKVTLRPQVKHTLLPGIYKMLDLCDKHAIAQLHTVLTPGVKEVFKILFQDYEKYHKYSGKV